ncbi:hypothetical protein [Sulfuriferula sp.]|uniref:hypothetical protein n=1 Tax=Sulfuriferula sp. TaxID=2025307 RepID=UPI00272F1749|nr:hypothetical protein [Sulfuriferula sp.]MDP2026468.1 hypothetical protein [Sulfuriferula sp.]
MKTLILIALALMLSGCESLQYAGSADYQVRPFRDAAGKSDCCEVVIHNGKEIAQVDAHVTKDGDKYTVDLHELGVAAFAGQKISAEALQTAVDGAVKAAIALAMAPLIPAAGAALAAPGIGAAALGAGTLYGTQKLAAPHQP